MNIWKLSSLPPRLPEPAVLQGPSTSETKTVAPEAFRYFAQITAVGGGGSVPAMPWVGFFYKGKMQMIRNQVGSKAGKEGLTIFDWLIGRYSDVKIVSPGRLTGLRDTPREDSPVAGTEEARLIVANLFQQAVAYTTDPQVLKGVAHFLMDHIDSVGNFCPREFLRMTAGNSEPKKLEQVLPILDDPALTNVIEAYRGRRGLTRIVEEFLRMFMLEDERVFRRCAAHMVLPAVRRAVDLYQETPGVEEIAGLLISSAFFSDDAADVEARAKKLELPAVRRTVDLYKKLKGAEVIIRRIADIVLGTQDSEGAESAARTLGLPRARKIINAYQGSLIVGDIIETWLRYPYSSLISPDVTSFAVRSFNDPEVRESIQSCEFFFLEEAFGFNVFADDLFQMKNFPLVKQIAHYVKRACDAKENELDLLDVFFALSRVIETCHAPAVRSVVNCLDAYRGKPAERVVAEIMGHAIWEISVLLRYSPDLIMEVSDCLRLHAGNPDAETLATELKKLADEGDRAALRKRIKQCLGR